jgi:uncharacterized membrane protein (DUF485 family)
MSDDKNQPIQAPPIVGKKNWGRRESVLQWTEILASLLSLIAALVAGISTNLVSSLIAPRIPTSVVVAFSIGIGVIIIVYVAIYLYRQQAKTKLSAIEKLKDVERNFFAGVEDEISALFSEKVG